MMRQIGDAKRQHTDIGPTAAPGAKVSVVTPEISFLEGDDV
jgi:hypothetical protein